MEDSNSAHIEKQENIIEEQNLIIQQKDKRIQEQATIINELRAKLRERIETAEQNREKSPFKDKSTRCIKKQNVTVYRNTVAMIINNWHSLSEIYAPRTLKELYCCLCQLDTNMDNESKHKNTPAEESSDHMQMTVEWAGSGKVLSYGFMLLKAEPIKNLGTILGALLPPNPRYCPQLHRVFHGHGGEELTSLDGTSQLLENEFIQLISSFQEKHEKCNHTKLMNKIAQCKKSANGPLQFMQKYIDEKEYPEEIRLACLQWAQAYRDEYGKTCDEVLTSGDLLVILPGMTVCVCMTLTFCNRLILILPVFLFHCLAGVKPLADILHGILKEWGISANADDSPSTWQGVTCAENGVDILQLRLSCKRFGGNEWLCIMLLLICDSRIIIITCYFDSCYYHF